MSFIKNNIKSSSERGFTIVELLIVIVVIGILAAITIVSFNGVTAKANATSAKAAASSVLKKAEAYNASENTTGYPTLPSQLTVAGAQSQPYGLTGVSFTTATTAPTNPATIRFAPCGTAAGVSAGYYDFASSPAAWVYLTTGTCPTAGTVTAG